MITNHMQQHRIPNPQTPDIYNIQTITSQSGQSTRQKK
jgi:hypothetical protein